MNNSKIIKTEVIVFDGDVYRISKTEVNVRSNHRTEKVSIKKIGEDGRRR